MAILQECPICHFKQAVKNKKCKCGEDLDKAKRSQRIKFWIQYRFPGGKQKKEFIGYSIEEARDADGKRRVQKREKRIFDIKPESKMTFNELTEWYLNNEKVRALASYETIRISLNKFNEEFGNVIVGNIKPVDLENYQARRLKKGKAPGTVDHEIGKAKTMINKAFDNDLVGGDTLKTFKRVKKTLKPGSDVRDRVISVDEFESLMKHSEGHTRAIIAMGYYTGMRKGEILKLTWDRVDLANRVISLRPGDTKDKEARKIPICKELYEIFMGLPNRLHGTDRDNHVFQFRGESITDIRTALRAACKDAGIEYGRFKKGGFIFHDLRHHADFRIMPTSRVESGALLTPLQFKSA